MAYCVKCGTEAIADFCAKCGSKIAANDPTKRKGVSKRVIRITISFMVILGIYSYVALKIGSVMP